MTKILVRKYYFVSILLFSILALSNTVNADTVAQKTMDSNSVCQQTSLKKSQEMIQFILNDLTETYTQVGGGGITGIKLAATNTYVILISQEERIDQITYELEVDKNCKITISNTNALQATPDIISPGETIFLTFPQNHPAYLAIRNPAGAWYSIHSPDDDIMMLTLEKYSATTNLSLHTQTLEGITWVEGVKTKALVFKTRGEYLVYMADNLETEPENTFHFMTKIQLK